MGQMVIVAYKPLPEREAELLALTRSHVSTLQDWGLATSRAPMMMTAHDGTILEVFEWRDGAMEAAHSDPRVAELWARYAEVCIYVPLKDVPESADMFAVFAPFDAAP